ncbi:MAG: hypothetical protein DWQ58_25215, partial [Microcystis aeruginosa TA09]
IGLLTVATVPHKSENCYISPSLKQRLAFLKLPMTERRNILKSQADIMLSHYQQDSEWQELMAGDIIEY